MTGTTESAPPQARAQIVIDLWTDVACPWCYVGEGRLEQAIEAEGLQDQVEVRVHSFELDPTAPSETGPDSQDYLVRAKGMPAEQVQAMEEQIAGFAREINRDYVTNRPVANTRSLHRVMKAVDAARGRGKEFFFDLQRGYFTGDVNPFDPEAIVSAAEKAGLAREDAQRVLDSPEEFDHDVSQDVSTAVAMGARGVPFMVFDQKFAAPGALPVDTYRQVLQQLASASTDHSN